MAKICIAFFLLTLSFSRSITVVISQKDLGPKVCQEIWTAAEDNLKVALELKVDSTNGTSQVFTLEPAGAKKVNSSQVFQRFRALLQTNNKKNQDAFLNSITQREGPVDMAWKYLKDEGILNRTEDRKTFINRLWEMWFEPTPTKQGFRHVFMGEQATTDGYSGFHNWYQLYLEQLKGPNTIKDVTFKPNSYKNNTDVEPSFIRLNFVWNGRKKDQDSSMFVGTSPAFDFAMFSLCSIVLFKENHQKRNCTCKIHNSRVTIRAINRNGNEKILTAFPTSVVYNQRDGIPHQNRKDCGFSGISRNECEGKGCYFDENFGHGVPHCFKGVPKG